MTISRLDMVLIMMLIKFIEDSVINKTNERLYVPITTQDYIKWVCCWLYMSCWVGICNCRYWWSTAAPSRHKGAPFRMNYYISRNLFGQILYLLQHTDQASEYEDVFHLMRQLEEAWNKNMEEEFIPSWLSVLDEPIMEWLNKYFPGFMYVGHKPHPFENEHHTISCAITLILFKALVFEGKDQPKKLGKKSTASLVEQLV